MNTGYQDSHVSGAIGSPYRDPNSRFTSYIHPQTETGNRFSQPYGASQYGSDGTASSYGGSSTYQSSNVPSSGAFGASGYGQQDQQSNSYYGYDQASDQSRAYGSDARGYGQSQPSQYTQGASDGSQYGSNSFGMGSQPTYDGAAYGQNSQHTSSSLGMGSQQPTYDGTAYGQENRFGDSYGSSMQSPMPGDQPTNYNGYSGGTRIASSQQQYGSSASSMQPSSRYSGQHTASDSRIQTPTRNMHGSAPSDNSRVSSSYLGYQQPNEDDNSRNAGNQGSSVRYFNPEPARTVSPPPSSRVSIRPTARGYQVTYICLLPNIGFSFIPENISDISKKSAC